MIPLYTGLAWAQFNVCCRVVRFPDGTPIERILQDIRAEAGSPM